MSSINILTVHLPEHLVENRFLKLASQYYGIATAIRIVCRYDYHFKKNSGSTELAQSVEVRMPQSKVDALIRGFWGRKTINEVIVYKLEQCFCPKVNENDPRHNCIFAEWGRREAGWNIQTRLHETHELLNNDYRYSSNLLTSMFQEEQLAVV